jgi:ABC-type multidrug transport system fused ATPase/permease subunit
MLIIAHRYTMIKNADYVYVINDGVVIEHGTPDELIAAEGWFAELARQSGESPESKSSPAGDHDTSAAVAPLE